MPRHLLGDCAAIALAAPQRPLAPPRVLDLGHGIFEPIQVAVGTRGDRAVRDVEARLKQ